MTCPSRPWPRQPSTPTGKWRRPCAAAIFARASPASWKSGRRDLPGSNFLCRWQPVFAQAGYAGHNLAQVKRTSDLEMRMQPVFAQAGYAGHDLAQVQRTSDLEMRMQPVFAKGATPGTTSHRLNELQIWRC